MNELIQVTPPVIIEQLATLKEKWRREAERANALDCTEENLRAVKVSRAEMRKDFDAIEARRKEALAPIRAKLDAFNAIYADCVTDSYASADAAYKRKISEVEASIKRRCEERCREYFAELCAAYGVEWLKYEQAGLKIDMASARQKSPQKLMDALSAFVARVACDLDAIDGMNSDNGMAVMAEYKSNGLSLAKAQKTVRDRREAAEAERKAAEARAERVKREAESVTKVEAAAPPVIAAPVAVEAPKRAEKNCYNCKYGGDGEEVDDYGHCWLHNGEPGFRQPDTNIGCAEWEPKKSEPMLICTFTVRGTRAQLIKVREIMKQEGIEYE